MTAKNLDRTAEIMAEEMTLPQMRLALHQTQAKLGEILGIGQHGVCRLEGRSDLSLSTLCGYVEALGGHLNIVVEFPDHKPVLLGGIAALGPPGVPPELFSSRVDSSQEPNHSPQSARSLAATQGNSR